MSRAEEFIQDYIKGCSNEIGGWRNGDYIQIYQPWLTQDEARRAVEIAREEIYEWLEEHKDMSDYTWYDEIEHESGITDKCITDLKQAIKDE